MKKIKGISILISFFTAMGLISGCSKQELPSETQSGNISNSEISDPMRIPDETDSEKIPSTSYGIQFTQDNVALSGNDLIVSPTLKGGISSTHVGIMVFVDGILQKYSTQNSSEKQYMKPFDMEAGSEKTHNLTVDARIDGDLEEHYVSMITMLAPEYIPSADTPHFGFYHKVLRPFSIAAPDKIEEISDSGSYRILKADNSVLTQKQLEKFGLDEDKDSGYSTEFGLLQSDDILETTYLLTDDENKLDLKFYAYTTEPVTNDYRITFFVNHEPVKFNGDFDFLDISLEGGKISETEIELDGISPGDFVYCMAIPLLSGEHAFKSESKMILNDEKTYGEHSTEASEPQGFDTDSVSISSEKTVDISKRMETSFTIGDNVYAYEYTQKALHKLDANGNFIKTREGAAEVRVHGDTISLITLNISTMLEDGAFMAVENPSVTLTLLDDDLEEIRSLEITENIANEYDFDDNRIVCVYESENGGDELCVFDWEQKNAKTLMTLSDRDDGRFNSIAIADGYVAFTATDKHGHYYGVCDFNGKSELQPKEGISNDIQVIGETALWSDMHVNVVGGEIPSGEIIMYTDGEFRIIKPENPIESQDVFLTGENEFITALSDGEILRQYKNGIKIAEFPLDSGEYATAAVSTGNKIFASVVSGGKYKLKIWEVKQ